MFSNAFFLGIMENTGLFSKGLHDLLCTSEKPFGATGDIDMVKILITPDHHLGYIIPVITSTRKLEDHKTKSVC